MLATLQIALPLAGALAAIVLACVARVMARPAISRAGRWLFFISLALWPVFAVAIIVQAVVDPSMSIGVTKLDSANAAASLSVSPEAFAFSALSRMAVATVVFVLAWRLIKPPRLAPN